MSEEEAVPLNSVSSDAQCFTVAFTNDSMWEEWSKWVLHRCEGNSTEKLVSVLHKVCQSSRCRLDIPWTRSFYRKLLELIRTRIDKCGDDDDDVRKRLETFASIVAS